MSHAYVVCILSCVYLDVSFDLLDAVQCTIALMPIVLNILGLPLSPAKPPADFTADLMLHMLEPSAMDAGDAIVGNIIAHATDVNVETWTQFEHRR